MRAVWAIVVLGVTLASCKKTPRSGASPPPSTATAASTTAIDAGPALVDASPPAIDAAQLSFEQAQLADDVALQVRSLGTGSFELPRALHTRFMKDHLFHGQALGHLEPHISKTGQVQAVVHLGPSSILPTLGLLEGDRIVKINGRLVGPTKLLPEEAYLRILLKLEDGAVDVELDRGPEVGPCCTSPRRLHLFLRLK